MQTVDFSHDLSDIFVGSSSIRQAEANAGEGNDAQAFQDGPRNGGER
jgi:hypothetical protein